MKPWITLTMLGAGAVLGITVVKAGMGMMGGPGMMESGMMNFSMLRHRYVMRNGLPSEYRGLRNPLPATTKNLEQGKALYLANCAACHGEKGRGDGEAGKALNPRPADIARFSRMPMASDGYLMWTVSVGGKPVGSAMPTFGESLTEEQRWKIILYLRRLGRL